MMHFVILAVALSLGMPAVAEEAGSNRHNKGGVIKDPVFVDPVDPGGSANSEGVSAPVITPGGQRSTAPTAKAANLNPESLTVDGKSQGTGPKAVKDWASKEAGDGNKEFQKGLNINGKDVLATVTADSNGIVKSIQGNGVSMQNPVNRQGRPATLDDVSKGNFAKGSGLGGPSVPVAGSC